MLRAEGRELIAPGYQPFEAVDVLVMNLVPQAERLPVPSLDALLAAYPGGLTTAEVARVLADTTNEPDLAEAEDELIRLAVAGGAKRQAARPRRALDRRLDAIRTVRNVRLAARSRS